MTPPKLSAKSVFDSLFSTSKNQGYYTQYNFTNQYFFNLNSNFFIKTLDPLIINIISKFLLLIKFIIPDLFPF